VNSHPVSGSSSTTLQAAATAMLHLATASSVMLGYCGPGGDRGGVQCSVSLFTACRAWEVLRASAGAVMVPRSCRGARAGGSHGAAVMSSELVGVGTGSSRSNSGISLSVADSSCGSELSLPGTDSMPVTAKAASVRPGTSDARWHRQSGSISMRGPLCIMSVMVGMCCPQFTATLPACCLCGHDLPVHARWEAISCIQ